MSNVRTKSQPVPARDDGELDVAAPITPLTTSFTGPVAADDDQERGALADALARPVLECPGPSEMSASPSSPRAAARCAISGHRFPSNRRRRPG